MQVGRALRTIGPWALTIGGAAIYAFWLVFGSLSYSSEHRPLPALRAPLLGDAGIVTNDSLRGQPAIVNVWAPWCAPCRRELPGLDQVATDFRGRVQVVGVMTGASLEAGRDFEHNASLAGVSLLGADERFVEALGIEVLPTTFFVDAQGNVVGRQTGPAPERFFREKAEGLLNGVAGK